LWKIQGWVAETDCKYSIESEGLTGMLMIQAIDKGYQGISLVIFTPVQVQKWANFGGYVLGCQTFKANL
jgi:hypothetical protein